MSPALPDSHCLFRLPTLGNRCAFATGDEGQLTFQNLEERRETGELCVSAPFSPALLGEALRVGFEQLGLAELHVHPNPADGQARQFYEEAGFHRDPEAERCDPLRLSLRESDWRAACGLGPRVVLMQPHFLPWLGYLELIDRADVFVFLDDFQFSRQSWGQRNRLFVGAGKVGMVTLPIRHERNLEARFLDLCEADTTAWRRKLRNLLICNYRRAPYGTAVLALADEWLAERYGKVAELEIALIEKIAAYVGLEAQFVCSSTLGIGGLRRSCRLRAILEKLGAGTYVSARGSFAYMKEDGLFPLTNLPVYFQNHTPRRYSQHGSDEFFPRLSCLDALANLHPDEVRIKLRGTDWWLNWDEREAMENAASLMA